MPSKRASPSRFPARLRLHPQSGLDVGIVLSLFLTGTLTGLLYCLLYAGNAQYYQKTFGPAVMFASGHGFANPDTTRAPKIQEFLALKRDWLSRDDTRAAIPTVPLNLHQKSHRYLLLSVGFWWRLAGISWRQVAAVNAVLYGFATVALYAIFRLALRRAFAVFGTFLVCFSATQLENLVHLRDYSKAPFILAAIAIIGTLALRSIPRRRLLGLSALCGAILGIGMGFRSDVVALCPVFVFVLIFFYADKPWQSLSAKFMALALFVLSFAVFAGPILASVSSDGSNMPHVILLGFMDPFDAPLQINGSIYSFGQHYNDSYVASMVGGYAERLHHVSPLLPSPDYGRMGLKYLLTLAGDFPADMLTRFLGSVVRILELPFTVFPYNLDDRIPFQGTVASMYQLLDIFKGLGVPFALLLLAAAAIMRLKYGLFVAFALLALSGLPSLQFGVRHYFHLQFLSILSMLVLVHWLRLSAERVIRECRSSRGTSPWIVHARGRFRELWPTTWPALATVLRSVGASRPVHPAIRAAGRVSLMGLLIVAISILPVWGLRRYQDAHLKQLFHVYLSAEKEAITPVFSTQPGGKVLMTWGGAQGRAFGSGHYLTDYYVVDVASDSGLAVGDIGLKYRAPSSYEDFSRTIAFRLRKGINRLFFPVYSIGGSGPRRQFVGLEVSEGVRRGLRGIFRVRDLTDKPLLLELRLASDWESERLFQTLKLWERPGSNLQMAYSPSPPGSAYSHEWVNRLQATALNAAGFNIEWVHATMVKPEGSHILVDGRAISRFHYLVQFKKLSITKGALLVARGRLERGGLAIGLLKENKWYNQVLIDQPGEFVAAVEVGEAGVFVPLITNATERAWRRSRFMITEVGILESKDPQ